MGELVSYAKANPGKLNYGSTSATSVVAAAQFVQASQIDVVHVPYQGDAPLLTDLLADRIQFTFAAGAAIPHAKDGKLRVLATLLPARSSLLPEIPTSEEAGIRSITIAPGAGLFGPARMHRDTVHRLSGELSKALARADVREQLGRLAFEGNASSADELGLLVKDQLAVWRNATRAAGIQPE